MDEFENKNEIPKADATHDTERQASAYAPIKENSEVPTEPPVKTPEQAWGFSSEQGASKPNVETMNNTTYHYSYINSPAHNPSNATGYRPVQSTQPYSYSPIKNEEEAIKPKKKSNAPIIIIIVLSICLIVAIAGIIVAVSGNATGDDNAEENTTSQIQNDPDGANAVISESEDVPLKESDGETYTVAGVAKYAMDSCVGITVYSTQQSSYYNFYGYGSGESSGDGSIPAGEGSGVIMSESNGKTYVLTAAHVISDADKFTVTLNDDTEYDAQMVGYDAQTDIGVLSIDVTGLKVAEFADSDGVVVGEQVVAIGCPGGLEFKNSITSGYVSALDRPVSSSIGYNKYCIQTDAAINPGNSGGALFNMQGQVIGINSSKIASTEYEGMGFAVPSKTAIDTANSLIKVGYVAGRAKIGVSYNVISSFNNADVILEALKQKGYENANGVMVIEDVEDSSDLSNKDVKKYDMIVAVEGETLTSIDVMTSTLSEHSPGDTITLTIARVENDDITIRDVECKLVEATND